MFKKQRVKLRVLFVFFISTLLFAVPVKASEVTLQGEIVGGRFLVPMRGIFEALGAVVDWDGEARTVTGTKGDITVKLSIDSKMASVNGKTMELDVPATIIDARTFVPTRFVGESLGANVDWDGDTRVATITQGHVVIRVYEAPIPDISHIKNMDRFCAVGDLQLQGSAIIMFFAEESSVEDMLGTPEEMKLENKGYIRDPVGIFDLKTMWYPGFRLKYVRELPPPHFTKEKREIFRFKEAEVFKAGIKGPRGIEVGNSLKEVLDKFPAPYQDEKNMRQYGSVDIENGSVNKIEFSDYVPDSPYGIMVHHFNFTVYFLDNRVDRYHIKHIMYDL